MLYIKTINFYEEAEFPSNYLNNASNIEYLVPILKKTLFNFLQSWWKITLIKIFIKFTNIEIQITSFGMVTV